MIDVDTPNRVFRFAGRTDEARMGRRDRRNARIQGYGNTWVPPTPLRDIKADCAHSLERYSDCLHLQGHSPGEWADAEPAR